MVQLCIEFWDKKAKSFWTSKPLSHNSLHDAFRFILKFDWSSYQEKYGDLKSGCKNRPKRDAGNPIFNPKATERKIKVQNPIKFPFSFKTVGFLAVVFSCNPLALNQRKYTLI